MSGSAESLWTTSTSWRCCGVWPALKSGQRVALKFEGNGPLGKILVEVHQSFIQVQRHSIDYEGVWRRRLPIEVGGRRAFRLDDVDALAYHALTMSVDEFQVRLVRYVDLWLLLRHHGGLALAAAERAREWRSRRALYGALRLAGRLIPEVLTDDVEMAMNHALAASTRRFLDRCVLPSDAEMGRIEPLPRARQLWRKALLMDTPRHRLSFAISHAEATIRGRRSV